MRMITATTTATAVAVPKNPQTLLEGVAAAEIISSRDGASVGESLGFEVGISLGEALGL